MREKRKLGRAYCPDFEQQASIKLMFCQLKYKIFRMKELRIRSNELCISERKERGKAHRERGGEWED